MVIAEERNVSVSPVRFVKIQQNAFVWLQNVGTKQKKNKGRHVCFYCAVFIQIILGLAIIQRELVA